MKLIRVTSHRDGKLLADHIYAESRQDKAIERFLRAYPEHRDCIIVAEDWDSNDPAHAEYINIWLRNNA